MQGLFIWNVAVLKPHPQITSMRIRLVIFIWITPVTCLALFVPFNKPLWIVQYLAPTFYVQLLQHITPPMWLSTPGMVFLSLSQFTYCHHLAFVGIAHWKHSLPSSETLPWPLLLSSLWLPWGQFTALCGTGRVAIYQLIAPPYLLGTPFRIVCLEQWKSNVVQRTTITYIKGYIVLIKKKMSRSERFKRKW